MTTEDLTEKVLESSYFKNANTKAGRYIRNTKSLLDLLKEALNKSNETAGDSKKGVFATLRAKVVTLGRMIKAYSTGEYQNIPKATLLKITAGLIYFVSPLDFIPDIFPVIGLTDDLAVILWIVRSIREDIEAFEDWEKRKTIELV